MHILKLCGNDDNVNHCIIQPLKQTHFDNKTKLQQIIVSV